MNENVALPRYGRGEGFYRSYRGKNSQRHLQESRLYTAIRTDRAMRRHRGHKEINRERKRGGRGPGQGEEPREHRAKIAGLYK